MPDREKAVLVHDRWLPKTPSALISDPPRSLHDLSTITNHVTQQPLATGRPPGCWRTARETPDTAGSATAPKTIAVPRSVRPLSVTDVLGHDPRLRFALLSRDSRTRE